MNRRIIGLLVFAMVCYFLLGCDRTESNVEKKIEPLKTTQIYNPDANAVEDIAAALVRVKAENKNVLLMFGGNWCPWCRMLHHIFQENTAVNQKLNANFELVMIDIGRRDKNMDLDAKYGEPNKLGLPALVILNATGEQIGTQETGVLELPKEQGRGHDPEKLLAFFEAYKPIVQ
ncbi:thioredoxin family protein [bacterium]|nr:thioredoxin family protein [bacterium]